MHTYLKRILFTALFLFSLQLGAETVPPQPKKTICLNMIVKNESSVITRCLSSTLPIIDYWVIVDTGSSDGTQDIIKDHMKKVGVPGELHERPWVNFEHNRNEAIELAKGKADYLFFIDADEFLTYEDGFKLPELDKDYYYGTISFSGTKYDRIKLVSNKLDWEYVGVLHEALVPLASYTLGHIDKMDNVVTTEGARSKDPQKYLKDAKILEDALVNEPDNARYTYYLAQSYRDAGEHAKALEVYEKRISMGGWDQEVFVAMLGAAQMQETLSMPKEIVINGYNRAYQFRRSRVEPLYFLANYYRHNNEFAKGYAISKVATALPRSKDNLFVQEWMYDYGIPLELSVCAYWTDRFQECQKISLDLLKKGDLPSNVRECVERNLEFANGKLVEQVCQGALQTAAATPLAK